MFAQGWAQAAAAGQDPTGCVILASHSIPKNRVHIQQGSQLPVAQCTRFREDLGEQLQLFLTQWAWQRLIFGILLHFLTWPLIKFLASSASVSGNQAVNASSVCLALSHPTRECSASLWDGGCSSSHPGSCAPFPSSCRNNSVCALAPEQAQPCCCQEGKISFPVAAREGIFRG